MKVFLPKLAQVLRYLTDEVCWEFLLKMGGVKVTVKFAK